MSTPSENIGPRYRKWRLRVFATTWLAYVGYYLVRQAFSVAKIPIVEDATIRISRAQLGWVDSGYSIVYAAGQFIWGPLGDRFGPRRVVMIGLSIVTLTAVIWGFAPELIAPLPAALGAVWLFLFLGIVQGIGQSSGWSPLVKNMASWFSLRERGRVMGWWSTNFAVGAWVGVTLAGVVIQVSGHWRFSFFVSAFLLLGIMTLFRLFQRDRPQDVGLPSIEEYHGERESLVEAGDSPEDEPEGSWTVIAEVFRNPIVWVLAVSYFSLKLTRYTFMFWGPLYVKDTLGTGIAESALIKGLFDLGGPLGMLAAGYASDRLFGSRRMPVVIISLVALAAVLAANTLFAAAGTPGVCVFLFAAGFFLYGPDALISGTAAMDFGTKKAAGTAAGMINGVGSIGSVVAGILPAWLSGEQDWSGVFFLFIATLAVTIVLLLPLWNRKPPTA